jgi:hypothetical protein
VLLGPPELSAPCRLPCDFALGPRARTPQLLQQGGTGTVVLMDAQGALRGRVQLRAELVEAAGRLPPSLLDPAASPFADPT